MRDQEGSEKLMQKKVAKKKKYFATSETSNNELELLSGEDL